MVTCPTCGCDVSMDESAAPFCSDSHERQYNQHFSRTDEINDAMAQLKPIPTWGTRRLQYGWEK